jgi:hypothetical protein
MEQAQTDVQNNQYRRALRTLRAARNWFAALVLLALLVDLASLVAVRFWPPLTASPSLRADRAQLAHRDLARRQAAASQRSEAAPAAAPAEKGDANAAAPATRPAMPGATGSAASTAEVVYVIMGLALPFAMCVGLIFSVLMLAAQSLSLLTALVGRVGDAGYLASSTAWSIVLTAIFVPWDMAFGPAFVPSVLFLRPELIEATAKVTWGAQPIWQELAMYCARFAAYPIVALLVWIVVQLKASAGQRQASVVID